MNKHVLRGLGVLAIIFLLIFMYMIQYSSENLLNAEYNKDNKEPYILCPRK